jgi:hypothetical protein
VDPKDKIKKSDDFFKPRGRQDAAIYALQRLPTGKKQTVSN